MVTSMTTTEADWSPIRRAAYSWRSASIVSWTVPPLMSGSGLELLDQLAPSRHLDTLAAGLTAQRLFQFLFETFLADLHTWYEEEGVLVLLLIFRGGGGADVANELPDRRSGGIETGETLGRCNAR